MRILFVSSGLGYGGAETQLIAYVRELKRIGHEVAIFLLTPYVPRLPEIQSCGATAVVGDKHRRLDVSLLWQLRQFICSWQPDLIHGFLFDGNVYARLAAVGCGVPVLNSERSSGYRLRPVQNIVHWPTRRLAAGVIANSYIGADHAKRLFSMPGKHVHVVWNGIDLAALAATSVSPVFNCRQHFFSGQEDVKLAIMVGSISRLKDYHLALSVAEALVALDGRWRVLFVGAQFDGQLKYKTATAGQTADYAAGVRARYEAMTVQSHIKFVGQRTDTVGLIAQADVLFSTSLHEGFPNVVLEAMAVGTPVVATEYSDIRRILPTAWQVVASRDPKAIAEAILLAQVNRVGISKGQRDWVERNATLPIAVARLLDVYVLYARKPAVCRTARPAPGAPTHD